MSAWWIYAWTKQNLLEDLPAFSSLKQELLIHHNPLLCTEFLAGRMGGGRSATARQSVKDFQFSPFSHTSLNADLSQPKIELQPSLEHLGMLWYMLTHEVLAATSPVEGAVTELCALWRRTAFVIELFNQNAPNNWIKPFFFSQVH